MLNSLIISTQEYASKYILPILNNHSELSSVGISHSTDDSIAKINLLNPDIVIIDIDNVSIDAFSILASFPDAAFIPVLISDTESSALSAIRYGVRYYFLKSNLTIQLPHAVANIVTKKSKETHLDYDKRMSIRTSTGMLFLEFDNIIRVEAAGSYCTIYLTNGKKKTISKPLCKLEKLVPTNRYFRTHHSHLVNSTHINMFYYEDGGYLHMRDGSHVPIARRRRKKLISFLGCTA